MCRLVFVAVTAALLAAPIATAQEAFYVGRVMELEFQKAPPERSSVWMTNRATRDAVSTEGAESLVFSARRFRTRNNVWNNWDGQVIAIRGMKGQKVTGTVLMALDEKPPKPYEFSVTLNSSDDEHRKAFWHAWHGCYADLITADQPGGAWFRHQMRRADAALNRNPSVANRTRRFFGRRTADDTFALMSGGRAVSENLQLDREIPIRGTGAGSVALSSIQGITVREFDWTALNKGLTPEKDPLASYIPSDQHAIFVPSFNALVTLADNASEHGTPLLQMAEPRSENARSRQRYEQQLCLSLNSIARAIGPQLIDSVAMTGGDAYLRTGSDVAVLMESKQPEALLQFIKAQQTLARTTNPTVAKVSGAISGVDYTGLRTVDREICTYAAKIKDAVVVTNSLAQLNQIIKTANKQHTNLTDTPEYTFFRNRYPRGEANETGLVILSDETIRRWCGPKWRIAASRRTRVAAAMAEIQARHLNDMVTGGVNEKVIVSDLPIAKGEEFVLLDDAINSKAYGGLTFQTPIIELDLASVSAEESRMYRRWRDGYQRNWSNYFDPIAVRFTTDNKHLSADVTVMPLIDQSRYNQLQEMSKGAQLDKSVGDPHASALVQWSLALNPDSPQLKSYTNFLGAVAPQIRVDPLSWIGNGVSLYIDRDKFWLDAMKAEDPDEFFEENAFQLPVALHVEVRNALKLTLFMTGFRAFVEQTVPGMATWEAKKHEEEPYVKIKATERAGLPNYDKFAIYYAATGQGLTITLNESLMHRALERRKIRRQGEDASPEDKKRIGDGQLKWTGQQVAFRVTREGMGVFEEVFGRGYQDQMRQMSFANLAILNEWKRLFPELDPVEVHQQFWQTRLFCPGGGEYVWNKKLSTMESTVYGSPQNRIEGKAPAFPPALRGFGDGEFGLTFEENGLRARMHLERVNPKDLKKRN